MDKQNKRSCIIQLQQKDPKLVEISLPINQPEECDFIQSPISANNNEGNTPINDSMWMAYLQPTQKKPSIKINTLLKSFRNPCQTSREMTRNFKSTGSSCVGLLNSSHFLDKSNTNKHSNKSLTNQLSIQFSQKQQISQLQQQHKLQHSKSSEGNGGPFFKHKLIKMLQSIGVQEFIPQNTYTNENLYQILEVVSKNFLFFQAELKTHKKLNDSLIMQFREEFNKRIKIESEYKEYQRLSAQINSVIKYLDHIKIMLKGFALKELRQALFIKDLQDQIDEAKGQFHLMIDIKIIDEILFQYNFLDEGFDAAHKVQTCGELADDINKFIQNLIVDTRTVELDLVAPLNPLYIEEQLVQSYQKLQSRSSSLDQLGKHNRHHFGCHNHYTVGKALKDNQLDTFKLLAQLKRDNSKLKSVNYRLKSKHLDATIFLERQQMQLKINELEAQNAQLQTFNLNLHEKVKLFQKQNDELSHKAFFYKNQLDLLENNRTDRTVLDKYIGILLSKNTQELGPQEITQLRGLISSSQGLVYANEDSNSAGDSRGGSRCGSALSGIQGSIQEIRSQYLRQRAINDELVTYNQQKCL